MHLKSTDPWLYLKECEECIKTLQLGLTSALHHIDVRAYDLRPRQPIPGPAFQPCNRSRCPVVVAAPLQRLGQPEPRKDGIDCRCRDYSLRFIGAAPRCGAALLAEGCSGVPYDGPHPLGLSGPQRPVPTAKVRRPLALPAKSGCRRRPPPPGRHSARRGDPHQRRRYTKTATIIFARHRRQGRRARARHSRQESCAPARSPPAFRRHSVGQPVRRPPRPLLAPPSLLPRHLSP